MQKVQKQPPEITALCLSPAPPALEISVKTRLTAEGAVKSCHVLYVGKAYVWQATAGGCAGCAFACNKADGCRVPRMFPSCIVRGENGIFKQEVTHERQE